MRVAVLGNRHPVAFEADGSLALRPHPLTGHPNVVAAFEMQALLDGVPTDCAFADEEAGVLLVYASPDCPCYGPGSNTADVRALTGKVEIRWEIIGECQCADCTRKSEPGDRRQQAGHPDSSEGRQAAAEAFSDPAFQAALEKHMGEFLCRQSQSVVPGSSF